MKSVPKSFSVLGHTIRVVVVKARDWATLQESYPALDVVAGFYNTELDLIVLKQQKKEHLLHTFYHEMMHCLLYHMDNRLWDNEKFVEQLGAFIAQAEATAV
jgi:hypothetical protein